MSPIELTAAEEEELYAVLARREQDLTLLLHGLLRRLERSLYARLTVEEMERLRQRATIEP